MDIVSKLQAMAGKEVEIFVHLTSIDFSQGRWTCTVSRSEGNIQFRLRSDYHDTPVAAVNEVYEKFQEMTSQPMFKDARPALLAAPIEQPHNSETDDKWPF